MKQLNVTPIVLVELNVNSIIINETINCHRQQNNIFVLIIEIYLLYRCNIHYNIFFHLRIFYLIVGPDRAALLPQGRAGVCRHRRPRRRRRRRGSCCRSRRCREDRPSHTRVCRREERRSIATSSSRGASPGGKSVTPPPLPPPRASARPPPPHGNRPAHPP